MYAGLKPTRMDNFVLRYRALKNRYEQHRSPNARPLWHALTLFLTSLHCPRSGRRHAPRVLLADEVGFGKTIEAGMIIHQQVLLWSLSAF